jgi:hypothetical protein
MVVPVMSKNGWMLWLRTKDQEVRVVCVAIANPMQAKEAALEWSGGGAIEAYEEVPAARMRV